MAALKNFLIWMLLKQAHLINGGDLLLKETATIIGA